MRSRTSSTDGAWVVARGELLIATTWHSAAASAAVVAVPVGMAVAIALAVATSGIAIVAVVVGVVVRIALAVATSGAAVVAVADGAAAVQLVRLLSYLPDLLLGLHDLVHVDAAVHAGQALHLLDLADGAHAPRRR